MNIEPVTFRLSIYDSRSLMASKHNRNKSPIRHSQRPKPSVKTAITSTSNETEPKSKDVKHASSPIRRKSTNHENQKDEIAQHFTEIKLDDEKTIEDDNSDVPANLITRQNYRPDTILEGKLAHNDTFDAIGIMNLSSMNLTDRDVPMIIQRAFRNKERKCFGLNLRDNALTSNGIKTLVDSIIKLHINIRYICLSDNSNVGDEGVEHLIRLLQTVRSLTFLAIPNTGITDRAVRMLADVLCNDMNKNPMCSPLEKLYISFNKSITDDSLGAVQQIIEQSRTLKVFSVQHCSFSNKARRQLQQSGTKSKRKRFSLSE